jgi:hypothetical protein
LAKAAAISIRLIAAVPTAAAPSIARSTSSEPGSET